MEKPSNSILTLPVDVLQQILYHALFTGATLERLPIDTGVRKRILFKVTPFDCRYPNRSLFATKPGVLFSSCSIFHDIGTTVLYKNIMIDLCYLEDHERAPLFLSTIGAHNAALIRCLRLPLQPINTLLPRCAYLNMLNRIVSDFVKLETLIFVHPVPEDECDLYARLEIDLGYTLASSIYAILQRFGASERRRIVIENADILQALDKECNRNTLVLYPTTNSLQQLTAVKLRYTGTFKSWSALPEKIKRVVIQFAVLGPDRLIHPLHSMSTSLETKAIMPLLLTSRNLSRLTADVIYRDGTFASCIKKDRAAMYAWFQARTPQQLQMIERYHINGLDRWIDRRFLKFLKSRCPNAKDMEPSYIPEFGLHPCWSSDAHQWSAFLDSPEQ